MVKNLHKIVILLVMGFFFFPEKALCISAVSGFLPYWGSVEKETALIFAKEKSKEELVLEIAKSPENAFYATELTESQLETYITLYAQIEYVEELSFNEESIIQVKATLINNEQLFSSLNQILASPKSFMRKEALWAEHKKITNLGLNILEEAAWIRKNVGIGFDKGYNDTLIKLLNAYELLIEFEALLSNYNGLWQNLAYCQEILEEAFINNSNMLFIRSSLGEIYLQSDRPRAALDFIENIPSREADAFTLYIRSLAQIRLNHQSLAEQDIQLAFSKISPKDFLYSDLLILRGLLEQKNNNIPAMCKDYKEACLYNNCDPYYHTQSLCQ